MSETGQDEVGYVVAQRYRLAGVIGRGAFGRVWEATDLLTGENVALKILRTDLAMEDARLRREVAAMRLLRLSGVVQLLDEGTDGDRTFLVMERARGAPFPGGLMPMPWPRLEPIAVALLETLSRIHALGIVHRDLKPANILVDGEGRPTILDFGLARPDTALDPDEGITPRGTVLGTPAYLAPEQIRGDAVGPRADLYTTALLLFEALAGQKPHPTNDLQRALRLRVDEPAPPLATCAPGVPRPVAELVDALLAIEPADRPGSAVEVLDRLGGRRAPHQPELRRLGPAGPREEPLGESALRELFTGVDRLFHIPEDAARVLHRRTGGLPGRIADDITGWVQAGLARWDGDRVAIERDVIERLEAGLLIAPLAPLRAFPTALPPELDELLGWILLAHPHADAAYLGAALGAPPDRLEAELDQLEARSAVRRSPDGHIEPLWAPHEGDAWPIERRREVHRRIALAEPPGTPRRLYHLIVGAGDDVALGTEIAAEAEHLGRQLAMEGHLDLAAVAVSEGLRAGRRRGAAGARESLPLLSLAVEIAIEAGTPRALDRALYDLYRVRPRTPAIEQLAQLVRAALALGQRTDRALAEATEMPPFASLALERRRQALRVAAVRFCSLAEQVALIDEVHAWAEASADPATRGACAGWLGRMCYRTGRFAEAAVLHLQSAASERWVTAKLALLLSAASAQMEAFQLDEALVTARAASESAERHRLPFLEARAAWILRSIAYRTGAAAEPDLDLCEAAARLQVGDIEAIICLNEAAVAFRRADHAVALDLARRAQRAWTKVGEVSHGALLAGALALLCGADATGAEVDALVQRALSCPIPELGVQALGLVAMAGRAPPIEEARLSALFAAVTRLDQRLEVLSAGEALGALRRS